MADTPEVLTPETVPDFVSKKLAGVKDSPLVAGDMLTATEIHGGNLNYAFAVKDSAGNCVFVKQAPDFVKVLKGTGMDMDLSRGRMRLELAWYEELGTALAPHGPALFDGHFPRIYLLADDYMAFIMEFLGSYKLLQESLFAGNADVQICTNLGKVLALGHASTHCSKVSAEEAERLATKFANSELRALQHIFFLSKCWDDPRAAHLKADDEFMAHVAALRQTYDSANKEDRALCHGDLHAGSVMADTGASAAKIIDPEFAVYGPPGLDVGMLISTYAMAYCYHAVLNNPCKKDLLAGAMALWNSYEGNMQQQGMSQEVLSWTAENSLGFAGMEMGRTALGMAFERSLKIPDEQLKAKAEAGALEVAACCIRNRKGNSIPFLIQKLEEFSAQF